MNSGSPKKTSRIVELDSLRALAAINLLLFHFTHVYQVKYGFVDPLGFEWPYGKYGVQLFFMLSGFVNAMTLLRKKNPKGFLIGRVIRICPSYWTAIAMNLVLLTMIPLASGAISGADLLANLTIMPNLFGYECFEPVTWTLQIELLFYAMMIVLFVSGALKYPLVTFSVLTALSLLTCTAEHYWIAEGSVLAGATSLFKSLLILDYIPLFAIGVFLNQIKNNEGNRWAYIAAIVVSAIVFHAIDNHGHNPAVTVLLTGILALSAFGKLPILRMKPLVFISSISYSLYLLHNNFGCVLMYHANQLGVPSIVCLIVAFAASVALSLAVTKYFEQPFSKWLRSATEERKSKIANGDRNLNSATMKSIG